MRLIALFALVLAACGDSGKKDADPFDTFQLCYDEHHSTEAFPVQMAIEICCLDHPIGPNKANVVCGDTAATCMTYVNANLAPPPAAADVTAACNDYVVQRSK